jgi:hypothetical protein
VPTSRPDAASNMVGWLSPRERCDGRSVLELRAGFHGRKRRGLPLPALRLGAAGDRAVRSAPFGPTFARGLFVGCLISVVLLAIGLFLVFALTPLPWGKE